MTKHDEDKKPNLNTKLWVVEVNCNKDGNVFNDKDDVKDNLSAECWHTTLALLCMTCFHQDQVVKVQVADAIYQAVVEESAVSLFCFGSENEV